MAATMLCAFSLTGCYTNNPPQQNNSSSTSSSQETATGDLLAQIKERGDIIVAMEGTWAPWTYHDESDALVGYDVEVAQAIAQKLGVEVD